MTQIQIKKEAGPPGVGYFALSEMQRLNCGYYHDSCHALEVADLVQRLARAFGRSQERAEFLKQVALIHDADPRTCPHTGHARVGTPARVPVTLDWMEKERDHLIERFEWRGEQYHEAVALIARTDFPFDHKPRAYGTRWDGLSPVDVYRESLLKLSPSARRKGMVDALLLRFSDQIAAYVGSFERARKSVLDLVNELNNTGLSLTFEHTFKQTPNFLGGVGKDLDYDERLKFELGLDDLSLPGRTTLLTLLGWKKRLRLSRNVLQFKLHQRAV